MKVRIRKFLNCALSVRCSVCGERVPITERGYEVFTVVNGKPVCERCTG